MVFDKKKFISNSIQALIHETQTYAPFSIEKTSPEECSNNKKLIQNPNACRSLEELYQLCQKTTMLKTDLKEANLVFGTGNYHANLMLIGEAPGEQEDKQKEPFVGRSGQLLNKMIESIQLKREQVYITNVLKYRPKNNRTPNENEVAIGLPFLLRQIELVNPKIILCLGKAAMEAILKFKGAINSKRSHLSYLKVNNQKYPIIVTYHPAALLYNPKLKYLAWEDLKYVKKKISEIP